MRYLHLFFVMVFLSFFQIESYACGAKVISNSRSVNYRMLRATQRPSSILFYRNPDSSVAMNALDFDFEETIEGVGHTVVFVNNNEELHTALAKANYDLIVADLVDIQQLLQDKVAKHYNLTALPIISIRAKENQKIAEEQFGTFIWMPSRKSSRLAVIEQTVLALDLKEINESAFIPSPINKPAHEENYTFISNY